MQTHFFITTPLYYVNDKPHIGTAYSTILADVYKRYQAAFGKSAYLLTGVDEHGQKCQQAAEARGMNPQDHCDDMAEKFRNAWHELKIAPNQFFRTSSAAHKKQVQFALQKLFDEGLIYKDTYEGWYSVSDEIFLTEKELVGGKSPTGKEVQRISEVGYYFKMSNFQHQLIEHINNHPHFIRPESRRNEVLGFLRSPLNDLNISRPKTRLTWGIELPFDKDFVTYVWFDALLNYVTALGYGDPDRAQEFELWWQSNSTHTCHLVGKDILITHCVYWTTMLMALRLRLPDTIYAHGWILNHSSEKMSKSAGDVIDPVLLSKDFGPENLRYFLVKEIPMYKDSPMSIDIMTRAVNNDLANNFGNLLNRSSQLIEKYFDGKPGGPPSQLSTLMSDIRDAINSSANQMQSLLDSYELDRALAVPQKILQLANQMLEEEAPWKSIKTDAEQARSALYVALDVVRVVAILLKPVLLDKSQSILNHLGCGEQAFAEVQFGGLNAEHRVTKPEAIFKRLND